MIKRLSLLLAIIMILSVAFFGCGKETNNSTQSKETTGSTSESTEAVSENKAFDPFEKYPEPITITAVLGYMPSESAETPEGTTPENQAYIKLFKDKLNIDLKYKWIVNGDQFEAKFGAALASGDLPDLMRISDVRFQDLYEQGGLADITDAYNKYGSDNLKTYYNHDGKIINTAMRDNKIYGLPNAIDGDGNPGMMYFRKDWLDKLGMQPPKTISEMEALMDALMKEDFDGNGKTGDPVFAANNRYIASGLTDFTPIFAAYKSFPDNWYKGPDGKLINGSIQPETKQALAKLNEWYKKGYIAKDFASKDCYAANSKIIDEVVAGKYGILCGSWWIPNWPLNLNRKNQPEADWMAYQNPSLDGSPAPISVPRYAVTDYNVISSQSKHPEALIKMLNLFIEAYSNPGNPNSKGTERENWGEYKAGYVYTWLPFRAFNPTTLKQNHKLINELIEDKKDMPDPGQVPSNGEFWQVWDAVKKYVANPNDSTAWGWYYSRIAKNGGYAVCLQQVQNNPITYNEVYVAPPSATTKGAALAKLQSEIFLRIIMGEVPIDAFDKFVEDWRKMGGNDIEKEVNEWYVKTQNY